MRNNFLSYTPTRFLASTRAHPVHAAPWLESAPHNLDARPSPAMHTVGAPLNGLDQITVVRFRAQSAASTHPKQLSIPILLYR